jgi:hypothetical protein
VRSTFTHSTQIHQAISISASACLPQRQAILLDRRFSSQFTDPFVPCLQCFICSEINREELETIVRGGNWEVLPGIAQSLDLSLAPVQIWCWSTFCRSVRLGAAMTVINSRLFATGLGSWCSHYVRQGRRLGVPGIRRVAKVIGPTYFTAPPGKWAAPKIPSDLGRRRCCSAAPEPNRHRVNQRGAMRACSSA